MDMLVAGGIVVAVIASFGGGGWVARKFYKNRNDESKSADTPRVD